MDGSKGEPLAASEAIPDVVVFDFDGTLVSRDSFLDFAFGYCARRPARFLLILALLPLALPLALHSRKRGASLLLWALTLGTSTRSFVAALSRYATHTLPSYANDAIFVELAQQIRAGNRVVIATGTMPLLVRGLLNARELGAIPIVGSRLRRRFGGLVAETHCIGSTKVRELQRKLGIRQWSTVYTDSFADRALLSRAKSITLVGPSKRTLLRTQRLIEDRSALRVLRRG
ncbi:MAG TPA: HAD family hydrolase [Polyangiaceae bacterium]|nr:HAD family hydrolase [Polyangiaceae bacterium]